MSYFNGKLGQMINQNYVANALLRLQYFPNVKKSGEELPPIFSSATLTDGAALDLIPLAKGGRRWMEFRTRRFDGLVRRLKMPHPVDYSRLVTHMVDNWAQIQNSLGNHKSKIQPDVYSDGRIIQMDYVDSLAEYTEDSTYAHGKRFKVSTDISNFFPSVYSHSIDWALRGKSVAKKNRHSKSWEPLLDKYSSACVHGETNGLPIGPATSNILSEIILQDIDKKFPDVQFVRHIDDYIAYFNTLDEAELFISRLQAEIAEYGLDLNTRKTQIDYLGNGRIENWLGEVLTAIRAGTDELSVVRMLQHAEGLASRYKSKSVLKFALKMIFRDDESESRGSTTIIGELIRITYFHPHIIPLLSGEFSRASRRSDLSVFEEPLKVQIRSAARRHESDAVLWLLYILKQYIDCGVEEELVEAVLDMNDSLVMAGLSSLFPIYNPAIAKKLKSFQYDDDYDFDDYWLARYTLFVSGDLVRSDMSPFEGDWMGILRSHGVTFTL